MKKILLYIYPTFSEFEITVATAVLKKRYELCTVASHNAQITGESGLQFLPHVTLDQVAVQDFAALIIPGGDLIHIVDDEALFGVVREFHSRNKLIAAICSGPFVLAKAGVLEGKNYTCTLAKHQRDFLGSFSEENYHYEKVVVSGNVLTAQGHAYVEFGLALLEQLEGNVPIEIKDFYEGRKNTLMEQDEGKEMN